LFEHANRGEASGDPWVVLRTEQLGSMRLVVLVRSQLLPNIKLIAGSKKDTGILHMAANKGGLLVRFQIEHASFAFISCHLAAHEGQVFLKKRNADLMEILRKTSKGCEGLADRNIDFVAQTDHVFILGDLNYRIAEDIKDESATPSNAKAAAWRNTVGEMVAQREWDELWQHDELQHEMRQRRILFPFQEGLYHFAPTFKNIRGTGCLDLQSRTPSYCDRILWHSHPAKRHRCRHTLLQSKPEMVTSDHTPVVADFIVRVEEREQLLSDEERATSMAPDIHVLKAKAHGGIPALDADTGKSDCTLRFAFELSPEVVQLDRAATRYSTLEPAWRGEEIPLIKCYTDDSEWIEDSYLMIALLDEDPGRRFEYMASTFVPLKLLTGKNEGQEVDIEVPLVAYGQPHGLLTLTMKMCYPNPETYERPPALYQPQQMGLCHCLNTCHSLYSPFADCLQRRRHLMGSLMCKCCYDLGEKIRRLFCPCARQHDT